MGDFITVVEADCMRGSLLVGHLGLLDGGVKRLGIGHAGTSVVHLGDVVACIAADGPAVWRHLIQGVVSLLHHGLLEDLRVGDWAKFGDVEVAKELLLHSRVVLNRCVGTSDCDCCSFLVVFLCAHHVNLL